VAQHELNRRTAANASTTLAPAKKQRTLVELQPEPVDDIARMQASLAVQQPVLG